MGILTDKLVNDLLNCSNAEKEELGNKIVLGLGGNPQKIANGLPTRRGNADGGIDGRIPILRETIIDKRRPGGPFLNSSQVIKESVVAGFCIKIESTQFNRYQLGAFKNDLDREQIYEGIIITAKELSLDAKSELQTINEIGSFHIVHILLSDFIQGNFVIDFEFINDPREAFNQSLEGFLQN